MLKAKKKIYKNGLRVISIPMKDNPTVTVLVLVGTGSEYETKNTNGISHFLEHMMFKGTTKRPTSKSISQEFDSLGCQNNAFTTQEITGYYAKGDAKNFNHIFDVISDVYLNSTLPEIEIEKEKGVIIEEINMYEDMPQRRVQELFDELLYGNQPSGWNIAGTKENVKKMKRSDLINYKKEHYVAENTVVVVSGNITNEQVYKEVNKHFKDISVKKVGKKTKTKDKQTQPNILIKYKKTDQTHFALGVRTFPIGDKRNTILSVLSGVLSAGMSSRLFQKLREEMGVAYYVTSHNNPSLDHGYFEVLAGVNNKRIKEVIVEIIKECKRLTRENVDEKEINKVKACLIGNTKMSLESSDSVAEFYGEQEILRKEIKSLEEKIKDVEKVTAEDLQKMAQTIFKTQNLNLAIVGPLKDSKKLKGILKF